MKIKGINPLERHVEKIVLGAFAMFVLTVLLLQTGLVGGGRLVRVGDSERPLDRAMEGVRDLAIQRQGRLKSDQVATAIPASLPDPARVFDEAFVAATGAAASLAALGPPSLRMGGGAGDPGAAGIALQRGGEVRFAAIKVSKPSAPIAAVFEGTLDPIEVAEIGPSLASLLPPAQPFDARVPSIEATFDAEALRRSIEAPDGADVSPLPDALWQGKVELVDVEWSRQELGSDGQWGNEAVISPPPGRDTPRDLASKTPFQPADYRDLLERERVERLNIRRPMFYATISGRAWAWPSLRQKEETVQGAEDVGGLKRNLASVRAELEELKKRLERLIQGPRKPGDKPNNPPAPPDGPPKDPGGGGGGGGGSDRGPSADARRQSSPVWHSGDAGASGRWPVIPNNWYAQSGGSGGGPGGPPPSDGSSSEERRKEREAQARKVLEEAIAKLTKRETELVEQLAKKGVGAEVAAPPSFLDEPLGSLASAEMKQVTLWTHDLTAKPGATYRYKSRVRVTNPFYGQTDKLLEDQKSLAAEPVVSGEASDWSEPVVIEPRVEFFITSASEAGGPLAASARAGAEVYEFFYGYWRRTTISMTPGDPVAGSLELPELVTYELERLGGSAGTFSIKGRPAVERHRAISTGAFLLDTASIISGAAGAAQAYLRGTLGEVHVRRPASDAAEASRRAHFQSSASQAETAIVREPGSGQPAPVGQGPKGPQDAGGGEPGKAPPRPPPKRPPGGPGELPGREKF